MSTTARESKISMAVAEDEARSLLERLSRGQEDAAVLGSDLNDRYSAAPRKVILTSARKLLSEKRFDIPPNVVGRFLMTQWTGVKDQQFDEQLREILAVALELPDERGLNVAADLVAEVLGETNRPPIRLTYVPQAPAVLTQVFLNFSGMVLPNRERFQRWTHAAQPHLNPALRSSDRRSFNPQEASQILERLTSIAPEILSDELLAYVPNLIMLAGLAGAGSFLRTPRGQPFAGILAEFVEQKGTGTADVGTDTVVNDDDTSLGDRLSKMLTQVNDLFLQTIAGHECRELQIKEQVRESEARRAEALHESQQKERYLQGINRELASEADGLRAKIEETQAQYNRIAGLNDRLHADLRLVDENVRRQVTEQEDTIRRRMGEAINDALTMLRRDLERVLQKNPNDEGLRNVGIAFDSLHRKLLREARYLDDSRLPKELFDPTVQPRDP